MALEEPDLFADLCAALPNRIGVSLDAVDGKLKTKGWVEDAGLTVGRRAAAPGKGRHPFHRVHGHLPRRHADRVNVDALASLCAKTDIPVIAAGGVHTLDDIKNLYPLSKKGLEGAISGRAIYVGTLDVKEANAWIDAQ